MLSLPRIVHGAGRWTLPLCDATALALAGALVDESNSAREGKLVAAIVADPALAVWSVDRFAAGEPSGGSTSARSIAEWLAPRLIDVLQWPEAPLVTFTAQQHGQFAALVAESVAAASEVCRALGDGDATAHPDQLAALTSRWREWFKACDTGDGESVLPEWPLQPPAVSDSLSAESRAAGDEAWRRWLSEIPDVHNVVPPLIERLRQSARLEADFDDRLQTAKLDSLKEFAYGAGHELNNPLANIASRAQTLLREETHPERRRRLAAINTQAFRAHEMLADMMLFARPPQLAPELVDLVQLAGEVLAGLAEDAAAQQTALRPPTRREPANVAADPVQLRVALRAICANSLEALGRGGNVGIEISQQGDATEITVRDDGPGISADIREKIFDPFFSGREAGRGLGFGLSKAWRIIALHGGQIVVHSEPGRGATFTIALPMQVLPSCQQSPTDESLRH